MSKADDAKADRELMARIVKKHEAAKANATLKRESFSQAAALATGKPTVRVRICPKPDAAN
jgi:hypothetical protein